MGREHTAKLPLQLALMAYLLCDFQVLMPTRNRWLKSTSIKCTESNKIVIDNLQDEKISISTRSKMEMVKCYEISRLVGKHFLDILSIEILKEAFLFCVSKSHKEHMWLNISKGTSCRKTLFWVIGVQSLNISIPKVDFEISHYFAIFNTLYSFGCLKNLM